MVCRPVVRQHLECDRCGALLGNEGVGYESPMDARAAAYAAGWRFPNRVGKSGNKLKITSDLCPACVAGETR